jgi:hypothetical protein
MKKFKYLLIMFVTLTVSVSCSNDDNESDKNDLLGTWGITEVADGLEYELTMIFNANLSGSLIVSVTFEGETVTENSSFTYSTKGDQLTMVIDGETNVSTYSISGNKLTITEDGESVVFTRQ